MDRGPYETFQFIETSNNPDINQLLVLQDDGTLLSKYLLRPPTYSHSYSLPTDESCDSVISCFIQASLQFFLFLSFGIHGIGCGISNCLNEDCRGAQIAL